VRKLGEDGWKAQATPRQQDLPEDYYRILERIGKFFDNSISLKRSASGKGTMTIRFNSDEEVSKFLKALEDSGI
jgi:ParB family chromosome partitioning protein